MGKKLVQNLLHKELSYAVHGAAIEVRKDFGPGHKEKLYQEAFAAELKRRKILFEKEKAIKIYSPKDGAYIGLYRPDFIIDKKIIIEIKAEKFVSKEEVRRMYDYLRNSEYELVYFINFASPKLFVKRIIFTNDRKPFHNPPSNPPIDTNIKLINTKDTDTKSINNKNLLVSIGFILVLIGGLCGFYGNTVSAAEDGLSLTVTPPLFQLNIGPGESWTSSLKIVNSNPFDLTVYASLMDFEPEGEEGHGKFVPIFGTSESKDSDTRIDADQNADTRGYDATSSHSLASWVEISKEPIFIPKGQAADVVFTVKIPLNAEPGGHYAAILVGTKPMGGAVEEGAMVSVSSMIASLLFVKVKGDVSEIGNIREFKSEKSFYQKPDVNFVLRFENKGNVHLQPQGDIVIYNMWGKERGKIFINHKSSFGNILPSSVRKFSFEWLAKKNIFEAGKYKAIATLSFGSESRQNVSAAAYFWVVPVVPISGIIFGMGLLIFLVAWSIRLYIRRALKIEADLRGLKVEADTRGYTRGLTRIDEAEAKEGKKLDLKILAQPIYEEVLDLKKAAERLRGTTRIDTRIDADEDGLEAKQREYQAKKREKKNIISNYFQFTVYILARHWKVFVFLAAVIAIIVFLTAYFGQTFLPSREFEIKTHQEYRI